MEKDVQVLRISDAHEGMLCFDLRDLLRLVESEGPSLAWGAISAGEGTWVTPHGPRQEEVAALADRVDGSKHGIPFEWSDLLDLSNSIFQTIWGTFVAVRDPAAFSEIPQLFHDSYCYVDRASARFYELVEIVFQAVDSSFWLVWIKDPEVRERIRGAFQAVQTIPGMSWYEPRA